MKPSRRKLRGTRAFTLVEVMITTTIMMFATAGSLGVLSTGLRAMYKDIQRLATDGTLRKITLQVAKETIDSSEFYIFQTYQSLDGSVDLTSDVSPLEIDGYGTEVAYGDCLVLVTRVTVEETSNIRQFRVYYRAVTSANTQGALRYYEGTDYGSAGTTASLTTLLNGVNLQASVNYTGSRVLASTTRGRPRPNSTNFYPVFSTESATTTATNESVSVNIEVINGTAATSMLSSSSFNYTISPRR